MQGHTIDGVSIMDIHGPCELGHFYQWYWQIHHLSLLFAPVQPSIKVVPNAAQLLFKKSSGHFSSASAKMVWLVQSYFLTISTASSKEIPRNSKDESILEWPEMDEYHWSEPQHNQLNHGDLTLGNGLINQQLEPHLKPWNTVGRYVKFYLGHWNHLDKGKGQIGKYLPLSKINSIINDVIIHRSQIKQTQAVLRSVL